MVALLNFSSKVQRFMRYDRHVKSKIETFIEGDTVQLPKLPYALNALEPIISKEIMDLHYNKHHKAYVDNYNKVMTRYYDIIDESEFAKAVEAANFHGGGHMNHCFFWKNLRAPKLNNKPHGVLAKMIDESFGSFEAFKAQISHKCMDVLGAGWGWLALDPSDGLLSVEHTPNQVLLQMSKDKFPLVGIDVWEHAYILQYENRQDYVNGIFEVLNWEFAENQLKTLADKHNIKEIIDTKLKA